MPDSEVYHLIDPPSPFAPETEHKTFLAGLIDDLKKFPGDETIKEAIADVRLRLRDRMWEGFPPAKPSGRPNPHQPSPPPKAA